MPSLPFFTRNILFNLLLLLFLGSWLIYMNQPVRLADPALPPSGKLPCVSYSPYYQKGVSPLISTTRISKSQIDQDMRLLSQRFECVRIYSVSQGLDYVPEAASKVGLKVLLGAWIGWVKADNDKELGIAISLANKFPDTVTGLVVGNEVLLRGEQKESAMRAYLKRARNSTKVPVTYADVWEFWLKHQSLEQSVDFVTLHLLPYWEDDPQSIDNGMRHANWVMDKMARNFTKPLFIGETGWPSTGRQRQGAIPSQINQARYVREFVSTAREKGWKYNLIEAFDQPWKRKLEGTVGGYWGMYTSQMLPKFSFTGPVTERNDHFRPLYWTMAGLLAFGLAALSQKKSGKDILMSAASLGALVGLSCMLQWDYLMSACTIAEDWKALGGMFIAGNLAILAMFLLLVWKDEPGYAYTAKAVLKTGLFTLLLGAITTGWLLVTDGRYRDFPLSLFALPALQLSLGARLSGLQTRPTWRIYYVVIMAAVILSIACIWLEPVNHSAWIWLGIIALLALAAWPKVKSPEQQ